MLRHPFLMYISQYPPPDRGNSFCQVVKIRESGPKGPRFKSTHCHSGNPDVIHATPTFSPTTRWQHQKSHHFHLLVYSPDGSTPIPTSTQFSQFKVYDQIIL
ncbi:hypothetical protein AVEN_95597-1 [Araneus ventricosus]|uniref:Uncharacterized protein n=1 Tax=Araneus ventricosus TaxID=182803 RepID=A0A4Y2G1U5_ARAVE|nr:hypothetical protein AVEN_95597-1 [Araneus ventricosus]